MALPCCRAAAEPAPSHSLDGRQCRGEPAGNDSELDGSVPDSRPEDADLDARIRPDGTPYDFCALPFFRLPIDGETEEWTQLDAKPYNYTGLVLDRAEGSPMTSPETGGVLYASYRGEHCDPCCGNDCINIGYEDPCWETGVAR